MTLSIAPYEIYRTHMLEFKMRLQRAESISQSKSPMTGLVALDVEFCFLQIRRMVELITFSAALSEEARYKKLREIQKTERKRDHGDHTKAWEAAEILKRLSKMGVHALPIPIKAIARTGPGTWHLDRSNIAVTHGRLIEIYKKCGGFLHAKNPLGKDFAKLVSAERAKYDGAREEIRKCLQFLRELMRHHAVVSLEWSDELDPREAASPQKVWLVGFGSEAQQHVNLTVGEAQ
ncbi:hypothetical protein [Paraburkholderia sp. RL17-337-BIB-A]|uniref:hypothetical protein n=1 Tax=Paraburkholderia sp. RL17-337-BIB-A TaxID=3031636 RepID=UPI0038BBAF5F